MSNSPLFTNSQYSLCRNFEAFIHLVKGNLGTGLLALPFAVSKVGYLVRNFLAYVNTSTGVHLHCIDILQLGPTMLIVMGVVAAHCMILLTRCSQALCKRYFQQLYW